MIDRIIGLTLPAFICALVGFATLADDAMAATEQPVSNTAIWKAVAAWVLLSLFVGWLWSILKRAVEPVREDENRAAETTEDRFRRAYAESDGDHAGYVNYRRGK